ASSSNFETIFKNAFNAYKKRTGQDITSHPLAAWLNTCNSPDAILAVLRAQVQEFDQSRRDDERLTKWLNPTVNVLYALSATLGEGVGLVFSPAKVIFAGIGVLLLVSIIVDPTLWPTMTARSFRRPRTLLLATTLSLTSSNALRTSSNGSRPIQKFHRRQL
ncbi:hypothetical protein BJY52DRAFT_1320872, partial [Lactarius psammicola]